MPDIVKKIWLSANGLSTDSGVVIYATNEIVERNRTFRVAAQLPGHVAVGDDSGGGLLLLKTIAAAKQVEWGATSSLEIRSVLGLDLIDWIAAGCPGPADHEDSNHVDVHLVRVPTDGLRGLAKIRTELRLPHGLAELRDMLKSPPVLVLENVPYGACQALLDGLGSLAVCVHLTRHNDNDPNQGSDQDSSDRG